MTTKTWREIARAVILKAIDEARAQGMDVEATRAHVDAAYPFGERKYHPYKMWLSERKRLLSTDPAQPQKPGSTSDLEKLRAWNEGRALAARHTEGQ